MYLYSHRKGRIPVDLASSRVWSPRDTVREKTCRMSSPPVVCELGRHRGAAVRAFGGATTLVYLQNKKKAKAEGKKCQLKLCRDMKSRYNL
jgi:hypothetical protein